MRLQINVSTISTKKSNTFRVCMFNKKTMNNAYTTKLASMKKNMSQPPCDKCQVC